MLCFKASGNNMWEIRQKQQKTDGSPLVNCDCQLGFTTGVLLLKDEAQHEILLKKHQDRQENQRFSFNFLFFVTPPSLDMTMSP